MQVPFFAASERQLLERISLEEPSLAWPPTPHCALPAGSPYAVDFTAGAAAPSAAVQSLLLRALDKRPATRVTLAELAAHAWLQGEPEIDGFGV